MLPALMLTVGGTAGQVLEISVAPPFVHPMWGYWPVPFGGLLVVKLGLAVDGYREALATA